MVDDFDAIYGSKYLSAADLRGTTPRVKIGKVDVAELRERDGGTRRKWVAYFDGHEKGLVLNRTNATQLAHAFGKDATTWVGQAIELYTEMTSLGKAGVRVRPLRKADAAPPPKPSWADEQKNDPAMNDSIPF